MFMGNYRAGIDVITRYMPALSGDPARERLEMDALLVSGLARLGDFVAARAAAEEALALVTSADHPFHLFQAQYAAGLWRALQGNFSEAIPWLERSLESCRREGFYFFPEVAAFTGWTYARAGRTAEAIALLQPRWTSKTGQSWTAENRPVR
jgi:tetratricopeptide (TPR) repeat protein